MTYVFTACGDAAIIPSLKPHRTNSWAALVHCIKHCRHRLANDYKQVEEVIPFFLLYFFCIFTNHCFADSGTSPVLLIFTLHIFWTLNVFDMIFACRRNSVALLFHPDRQGKLLRTSSIQNPGSQDVRLKDLDLLKGFRGSRGRFSIRLEPETTSVNEQLLQNQNPALISLPVSQTLRLVPLFVVIRGIFQ